MKLSISDFRCFHEVKNIEFRPINILVGENSAGKSSFLAAIRFLFDLFRDDAKPSFNKDPFFLGSYDQIAHFRGGRFGRAKEFSFSYSGTLNREFLRRHPVIKEMSASTEDRFSTRVSFTNNRSQPAVSSIQFQSGLFGLNVTLGGTPNGEVITPTRRL
ncbi:AAA family ATPase [Bradyrhizobium sp. GCM10023182]|uniref:AAA family ATPase n=1 Tax=Bradyrhizobium zhengyangense TaxID=2911009 RepID=A0ABS9LPL9_9BRAD|nr:AAA family ATPase [Bradyrhizobium zhengyangense]MCG2668749.1 AAA family ATPase [Bradyrhizobium zhengyangense]